MGGSVSKGQVTEQFLSLSWSRRDSGPPRDKNVGNIFEQLQLSRRVKHRMCGIIGSDLNDSSKFREICLNNGMGTVELLLFSVGLHSS